MMTREREREKKENDDDVVVLLVLSVILKSDVWKQCKRSDKHSS